MRVVRANERDEFNGDLRELAGILAGISDPKELERFHREICTATECLDLAKHWALMKDLLCGAPFGAIGGGKAYLGVSVCTNGDITATTDDWEKAKIEGVAVEADGTVTLTVPATAKKGFMILKSKAGK